MANFDPRRITGAFLRVVSSQRLETVSNPLPVHSSESMTQTINLPRENDNNSLTICGVAYKRPDPQRPHKLDWGALRRHVEDPSDRTQAERARHFQVSRHCIWNALRKLAVPYKKKTEVPRARPASTKTAPPSRQTARLHR